MRKVKNREIAEISETTLVKIFKHPTDYLKQGKRGRPSIVDERSKRLITHFAKTFRLFKNSYFIVSVSYTSDSAYNFLCFFNV